MAFRISALRTLASIGVLATLTVVAERDAEACGGCFAPPENPTVVTDHRMIFSISRQQTTLYDQIRYTGNPASFGWVLPIATVADVGISSDVVFTALDQLTATQIIPPTPSCPPPPPGCNFASSSGSGGSSDSGVNVLKREVVGPYETVQLEATSAAALEQWLSTNGFALPADARDVVRGYVSPGNAQAKFLALKLLPGKGVQDMRPVRVTTQSSTAVLPLKMVAAGAGAVVGISLWVIAEGRYEPQNFPSFTIGEQELVWNWQASKSNYTDLRFAKTTAGGGRAWEIESSNVVLRQQVEGIVNQGIATPGQPFPQSDEDRAASAYLPEGGKTAVQVRTEDMDALFEGIPTAATRITRLRGDISKVGLDADLVLRAAGDQATLSNIRRVTRTEGTPPCPNFDFCNGSSGGASGGTSGRATGSGVSSGGGDGTFTCAAQPRSETAWSAVGLGIVAVAGAQVIRRRRRR